MTTSVTDDQVRAAFEEWKVRCGLTKKSNSLDSYKSSFSEGYKAALRSQGKVVNASDVQKVIDRWDNGQYGPGEVVQALRNLTAIIGEGD
jgi:hypothetical protein